MVNQLNCILLSTLNSLNSLTFDHTVLSLPFPKSIQRLCLWVVSMLPSAARENDIAMLTWLHYKFIIFNLSWFLSAPWQLFYSSPVCFLSHPQQLFHSFVTFPKSPTSPSTFTLFYQEKSQRQEIFTLFSPLPKNGLKYLRLSFPSLFPLKCLDLLS